NVSYGSVRHLQLISRVRYLRQMDFGIPSHSQEVSGIELNFHARIRRGRDAVISQERSVDYAGNPFASIAALDRDLASHQADARPTALLIVSILSPSRNGRCPGNQDQHPQYLQPPHKPGFSRVARCGATLGPIANYFN